MRDLPSWQPKWLCFAFFYALSKASPHHKSTNCWNDFEVILLTSKKKWEHSSFELSSSQAGNSVRERALREKPKKSEWGTMKGWGKDGCRHLHQHGDGMVGMETTETARCTRRPQRIHTHTCAHSHFIYCRGLNGSSDQSRTCMLMPPPVHITLCGIRLCRTLHRALPQETRTRA